MISVKRKIEFRPGAVFPDRTYIYRNGLKLQCPFGVILDDALAFCGDWCPHFTLYGVEYPTSVKEALSAVDKLAVRITCGGIAVNLIEGGD